MCGRYYVDDVMLDEIQHLLKEINNHLNGKNYARDIFPTDYAPVIEADRNKVRLTEKRWGYPGFRNKGVIFNARSESVQEKRVFQNGLRRHRIVVPARHFYEWNKNKEKFTFQRKEPALLYMAGFSDIFENEQRFVILTTQANDSMVGVHERMPLILEERQLRDWMKNDMAVHDILHQTPALLSSHAEYEQQTLF